LLATLELDAGDFPCDQVPELPPLSPIGSDWLWTELGRLLKETVSARRQLQFVERECQRWQRQAIQLAQQQQELLRQHKLRSLAAFAAGAGHELGSPLAVISGYAEQLLRQEKQLERIQALERILAQTRRIHALVLDLMFFARPPEPKKRRLRLDRLLRQVVGRFVCEAEQKQITLSCTCPDQAISMVADGSLLQTAIECLLRNALEAAPQGGRVSCSVELLDSDQVQVIVEDNGPGPDPAWQEHLFDPFFSGRQAGRGRGLGLSKVWRIAELHAGRITWHRTPHRTTQFVLQLPRS
jgi:two-component system NtrC family sensor kinase